MARSTLGGFAKKEIGLLLSSLAFTNLYSKSEPGRGDSLDTNSAQGKIWKKCNACKKDVLLGAPYYTCSVSTCNGLRTGLIFCSVPCFEAHLPGARHREAGAIERRAPLTPEGSGPSRTLVRPPGVASGPSLGSTAGVAASNRFQATEEREVLIIASRLKDYITAKSEYNTSAGVMTYLSDFLRLACDRAIDNARADGRRTVMDRDFEFLRKN